MDPRKILILFCAIFLVTGSVLKKHRRRIKRADDYEIGSQLFHDASGLKSTLHGVAYQLKVLMLLLNREFAGHTDFQLATELKQAEKFDDAILKRVENGKDTYLCIQAKHKVLDSFEINLASLKSTNHDNEFGLQKYFMSYRKMRNSDYFKNSDIKELFLTTNVDFQESLKEPHTLDATSLDKNHVLFSEQGKYYKIGKNLKEIVRPVIYQASEQIQLIKNLYNYVASDKKLDLINEYFRKYHSGLVQNKVIDTKNNKFHSDFIDGQGDFSASGKYKSFRDEFMNYASENKPANQVTSVFLDSLMKKKIQLSKHFGADGQASNLPADAVTPAEIDKFCEIFTFAVKQPNEHQLDGIIKQSLSKKYNQKDVERVYNALHRSMFDWLKNKQGTFITWDSTKRAVTKMQQSIFAPIRQMAELKRNFVGRESQLKELQNVMPHKKVAVITGLGGIGKSQLASKYAHEYVEKHPEGNVVWINAETKQTLDESFTEVAKLPQCQIPIENKNTKDVVNAVYDFFRDTDTLFVFDNVRELNDLYKTYKPSDGKLKVLITSRHTEWDNYHTLPLSELTDREAAGLVANSLNTPSNQKLIDALVGKLNKIPLALQQAISYINKRGKRILGGGYSIEQYIKDFDSTENVKNVLDHEYFRGATDELYKHTILTTWTMTRKAIAEHGRDGHEANSILDMLAYMPSIVPYDIFEKLKSQEKFEHLEEAVQLLKDYSMIDAEPTAVRTHDLVQLTTRLHLDRNEQSKVLHKIMSLVLHPGFTSRDFLGTAWNHYVDRYKDTFSIEDIETGVKIAVHESLRLQDRNKYDDARVLLERANSLVDAHDIQMNDDIVHLKMDLAEMSSKLGYEKSASKLYGEVASIEDTAFLGDAKVLRSKAKSYFEIKNFEKAVEYSRKCIALSNDPDAIAKDQLTIATSLLQLGKDSEALAAFQELRANLEQLGKGTIIYEYLIATELQRVDPAKAIEAYEKVYKKVLTTHSKSSDVAVRIASAIQKLEGKQRSAEDSEAMSLSKCLRTSRRKRHVNHCLFSKEDVEQFSDGEHVDSEKFLTYLKRNHNEKMNRQLLELMKNNYKIYNKGHEVLLRSLYESGGFEHMNIDERMNNVVQDTHSVPKWRQSLMKYSHAAMMAHGVYGSMVTCSKQIYSQSCIVGASGIAWSIFHLEKPLIQSEGKLLRSAGGALGGVFDVVDIGIQIDILVECHKRKDTGNSCSDREIRDSIVSLSIDGVSFVSGVTFAALSSTGVGAVVGFGLFAIQIIYNGVSAIEEFHRKYHTTSGENWSIFWRTTLVFGMAHDVQALGSRTELIENRAKSLWAALQNQTNDIKAFGMGLGYVDDDNHIRQSGATIVLNAVKSNIELSRVEPSAIDGAEMICLPVSTRQDFEKGISGHVPDTKYYCENSMVFADKTRQGKFVVFNLELVDVGLVKGSNVWNNVFMIYYSQQPKVSLHNIKSRRKKSIFDLLSIESIIGIESIVSIIKHEVNPDFDISDINSAKVYEPIGLNVFGGNSVVNRFKMFKFPIWARIVGGSNAENIIDFVDIESPAKIEFYYSHGHFQGITLYDDCFINIDDYFDENDDVRNYYYYGNATKQDTVLCQTNEPSVRLTVDTGGGDKDPQYLDGETSETFEKFDSIINCPNVVLSPFTAFTSSYNHTHTIFVKTNGYRGTDLNSKIRIERGTLQLYLTEFEIVNEDTEMFYYPKLKELQIVMHLDGNIFSLLIENYKYPAAKDTIFIFNKHKQNIIPNFSQLTNDTKIKINSCEMNIVCSSQSRNNLLQNRADACTSMEHTSKNLKILKTIQFDSGENLIIGSDASDIIIFHKNTIYAKGRENQDIYVIDETDMKNLIIFNYARDNTLDFLIIPEIPERFSSRNNSIFIKYKTATIEIRNFLESVHHQHLVLTNNKDVFIPLANTSRLVPFIQATASRNEFILRSTFDYSEIVVDASISDLEVYRDGKDWLILGTSTEHPLKIVIKDYYTNLEKWNSVEWYFYKNGVVTQSHNFIYTYISDVEYREKRKQDYLDAVQEYIRDFTVSDSIMHNHLNYMQNRVGLLIIEKVLPANVKLLKNDNDLVLLDKKSNNSLVIKDWDSSEVHRISNVEFADPLESISIRGLDRFILKQVAEMQLMFDKASENADLQAKYNPLASIAVQCIVAEQRFTYACIGFTANNELVQFTQKYCHNDTFKLFKEYSNMDQVRAVVRKLRNDVVLHGYNETVAHQCESVFDSIFASHRLPNDTYKDLIRSQLFSRETYTSLAKLRNLVDRGVDFNSRSNDAYRKTVLHLAVANGILDTVKFIVDQKVDVNSLDAHEQTPLEYAFQQISKICNPDKINYSCTDNHKIHKYLEIMEYLLSKSAMVKNPTNIANTMATLSSFLKGNPNYPRIVNLVGFDVAQI